MSDVTDEPRKRAEDVYVLVEKHRKEMGEEMDRIETKLNSHMSLVDEVGGRDRILEMVAERHPVSEKEWQEVRAMLNYLADHVIGPVEEHPHTGEPIINGHGLPLRDSSRGLIAVKARLDTGQIIKISIANLAVVAGAIATVISALG